MRVITVMIAAGLAVQAKAGQPERCWNEKFPCPVKNHGGKRTLEGESLKLTMAPDTLVEQRDAGTIQVIDGHVLVAASRPVRFQSPYGKIWCADACMAIFERERDSFRIKSLAGHWRLSRAGDPQEYAVPPASQIVLGEVSEDGRAGMEFPQSLPWKPTIGEWAELHAGTADEFKRQVDSFRAVWKEAVETISRLQSEAAQRTIIAFKHGSG
jgi:hypothetical protein